MARSEAATAAADRAVVAEVGEVEAKHRQFTGNEIVLEYKKHGILRTVFKGVPMVF